MQNKRIYSIGETVFDIILKGDAAMGAKAGGAMLNTAVSLGRLGLHVELLSEIGLDDVGEQVIRFLENNEVGTRYIYRFDHGKTALAIAFLDDENEARYTFYKHYPAKRYQIQMPKFKPGDIVIFGSFASLDPATRPFLKELLQNAQHAEAIVIYDPNFRKPHLAELAKVMPFVTENIGMADIVRGSLPDFQMIFNAWNTQEAFYHVQESGCELMIMTDGGNPVHFKSERLNVKVDPPFNNTVSTIGAGDSFNAGLIYGLCKLHLNKNDLFSLKKHEWETLLNIGVAFGSAVCESLENYIPVEFAAKLRH